jgi:hypothetical protein
MIAKVMAHQTNSIQASTATSFDVLVMDTLKITSLKSILEIGVMIKTSISCCYE